MLKPAAAGVLYPPSFIRPLPYPREPSRTKSATESESRHWEKIRYRRSKMLRRGLGNASFFIGERRQENGTESEKLRR